MLVPCFYLSQMKTGTFSELELQQRVFKTCCYSYLYGLVFGLQIESFHLNKDKDW
jgi:hypothetical protein